MSQPEPVISDTAEAQDDSRYTGYALPPEVVMAVYGALESDHPDALKVALEDVRDADLADLLEQLAPDDRRALVEKLGADLPPDVLTELEEGVRDDILDYIDPDFLAEAVRDMDTDDVVYLVEDLDEEQQRDVLDALDTSDRHAVEKSLAYPEYSAGRLMQRDLVSVPAFWTVGQVIDFMRSSEDLPDPFYEIFVVDPKHRPVGAVGLSRVMGAKRAVVIESLMETDVTTFNVDQKQEEVAYAFNQYHLVSAPVLDEDGRLAGVITIDDAMAALDEEAEEDLMRLGGVGDEELTDSVWDITKQRFPWLFVNLLTAIAASAVISMFDEVIGQIVALAVLMTIIASMGGNAGTQTMTVAVRALATKDLTRTNAMRVISRELFVGAANGVAFAVTMGVFAALWYGDWPLGAVFGVAMIVNMVIAALAGILIPIVLDKVGADPALASGVFVTTVTDVVGFFAFLGLAAAVLL